MTKQDKELLMKDLCARLPHKVKVNYADEIYDVFGCSGNNLIIVLPFLSNLEAHPIETCKPYLRPMSSMTDEEKMYVNELIYDKDGLFSSPIPAWVINECDIDKYIDFCNSNHLDWRGLIPMGLALPAIDGMYNF